MKPYRSFSQSISIRVLILAIGTMFVLCLFLSLRARTVMKAQSELGIFAHLESIVSDIDKNADFENNADIQSQLDGIVLRHMADTNQHICCLVMDKGQKILNTPDYACLIVDNSMTDKVDTTLTGKVKELARHALDKSNQKHKYRLFVNEVLYVAFASATRDGSKDVVLAMPFSEAYSRSSNFLLYVLLLFVAASAILVIVINSIVNRKLRPLSEYAHHLRRTAVNEYGAPFTLEGNGSDDMNYIFETVEYLTDQLKEKNIALQQVTAEQERLEEEIHIARTVQLDLVPNEFPAFPGRKDIDIYALMNPWREIGGNLYNYGITGDTFLVCIGDVSGKGIMAAIFMSTAFKLISTGCHDAMAPSEVISVANRGMSKNNESNMFVTMFAGNLDLKTGIFTYCNAGQDEPLIVKPDGSVCMLEVDINMPVGLMPETEYTERSCKLEPGTMVVLYTDGIVEASNEKGELYGVERLKKVLASHANDSCEDVTRAIKADVLKFVPSEIQDDCTSVVFRYTPQN